MPIVMSEKEWARINRWTNSDYLDPEVVRRREYVKYLDATSREMTKSWPNSLENVNKRNDEMRQARTQAAEQANTKFYKRYLKRKKEEQERLMYSARDIVFKNKDAPKLLLSAVIATAVQKERADQVKFINERRREAAEKKRKDDDEIIQKAQEWNDLMENKRKKRFEANKQHQRDILEQAQEISERNRKEYEMELNLQKFDNIKANEEMDAIKAFDIKFDKITVKQKQATHRQTTMQAQKTEEKARIFRDMERAKQACDERKHEQDVRAKMDDKLIEVLNKSRARVEARRKKTEQDVKTEKLRVLEAISLKLESGDAQREIKEKAILDKAIREKNEMDDARRRADLNKKIQFRKERQAAREQYLRDEEQRLHEFNTIRQWEIMNRFKNNELYEDFKGTLRKEKERKIKEYREDILKLWKEREDREARERSETRYFYGELAGKKIRDADNKVLAHAAHLLEECKQYGRPDFTLRSTIDQYCKMNRLYPMPQLPASMKEHFRHYAPQDNSQPDADYEATPLLPEKQIKQVVPETSPNITVEKRAGLQEINRERSAKLLSKDSEKKTSNAIIQQSQDYKRAGPANGLQRRNLQMSDILPATSTCKNPNCHCNY